MAGDPLQAALGLRELIETEALEIERSCTLSQPVVDAIERAGLFRLAVPNKMGGMEASPSLIIDVCEALAFADGSVGWAYAQNVTVGAYAAYLDQEYGQALADSRAGAGMFAPLGVAHEEAKGYRVSGNYAFGSGSQYAEYMGGAALVMRDGEMLPIEDGVPPVIAFIVPREKVVMKGNWDTMGLRGTGSFDFEVPEQFVEKGQTFKLFYPGISPRVTGGALYGLGSIPIGTIGSCAFAIGVASRALHEIAEIAKAGRTRLGSLPLAEQVTFQRDYGIHVAALKAVRLLAKHSYEHACDLIERGESQEVCARAIRETKADANYVTRIAKQAVTFAWEASGSAGVRNPSRLQRCFRDIYVGCAHMVFDDRNYLELAKTYLGVEPAPF